MEKSNEKIGRAEYDRIITISTQRSIGHDSNGAIIESSTTKFGIKDEGFDRFINITIPHVKFVDNSVKVINVQKVNGRSLLESNKEIPKYQKIIDDKILSFGNSSKKSEVQALREELEELKAALAKK